MTAARRARFDEHTARDALGVVGALIAGVLLILLGRVLRAVDDNLADLD